MSDDLKERLKKLADEIAAIDSHGLACRVESLLQDINWQDKQAQRILDLEEQLAKAQTAVAVVERLKEMVIAISNDRKAIDDSVTIYFAGDQFYCAEGFRTANQGPTLEAAVLGVGMEGER